MTTPLLQTKLYIPAPRPELVPRPRLIERLNAGLHRKLTLVSAPAGFGKTTLVSAWMASHRSGGPRSATVGAQGLAPRVAWLSLDESDSDLTRFLTYLVAALQTIATHVGEGVVGVLQSPQPPPARSILTVLLNEIATIPDRVVLVLDDYHVIDSAPVDSALTFLLEHMPSQIHMVIATRQDPHLPLARLRVQGQLTELRASDLRFTSSEAAKFLNQVMGLDLSGQDITVLENRTEGWIAGLQLAALALQGTLRGRKGSTEFIRSFTGSHHHVLDYLIEEVLEQQTKDVQAFLLQTAILDRLTGSLCDALTGQDTGQVTLEMLDRANLFIVPLDNERRWYRYHYLFADLLRQRLRHSAASSTRDEEVSVTELHIRASVWYENNGLETEAFHHAAAANDVGRAQRLIQGGGVPLQYRGAAVAIRSWLASLSTTVLDARPLLWVTYASVLNLTGQPADAEQKLQAAEAAIAASGASEAAAEPDERTNDIVGHIAAIRAMMAVSGNEVETIIAQSHRALECLHPDSLAVRTITIWTLGRAYQLQGDRAAASRSYSEVISISQASGDIISTLAATTGLGAIQESENQLFLAAESYRRGLQLFGGHLQPVACETCLGLARILYEWNDLDAAEQYGQQSLQLARHMPSIDTFAICEVLLARLKLVRGDVAGAASLLAEADQYMRQHSFGDRMHEVVAAQVRMLLYQGDLAGAAHLAEKNELSASRARVHLAQGEIAAALAVLEPFRQQVDAEGMEDERLKVMVLQAVALHARGAQEKAVDLLGDALALAEPGGLIRVFVDEGPPMARLLYNALSRGISSEYVRRLLAAFPLARLEPADEPEQTSPAKTFAGESEWIEPLSKREIQVLELIAEGLTNQEIASRLTLSLNTVKSHARHIYGKLGVRSRTQAVARARVLGVLPTV